MLDAMLDAARGVIGVRGVSLREDFAHHFVFASVWILPNADLGVARRVQIELDMTRSVGVTVVVAEENPEDRRPQTEETVAFVALKRLLSADPLRDDGSPRQYDLWTLERTEGRRMEPTCSFCGRALWSSFERVLTKTEVQIFQAHAVSCALEWWSRQ